MKHFNLLLAMLFMVSIAKGQIIDFENLSVQEGSEVTNQFCIGECCVTFYVGNKISPGVYNIVGHPVLAKVGSPKIAFKGPQNTACNDNTTDDMVSPVLPTSIAGPDCYFLTDDVGLSDASTIKSLIIEYSSPVSKTSGQILDIDIVNGTEEIWKLTAFQNSGGTFIPVSSQTLDPSATLGGDGGTAPFAFNTSTPFDRIVIEYTGTKSNNIGLGFDNFSICSINTPCIAEFSYSFSTAYNIFTFTANNQINGSNYTWDFGDGTPSANGSQVYHAYTQAGTYKVCLLVNQQDVGRCRKCFSICVTEEQIKDEKKKTSKSKPSLSSKMDLIQKLYPNPAKEQITLELNAKRAGKAKLIIYGLNGKKVISNTYSLHEGFQKITQHLPNIIKGVYFCKIEMNGKSTITRFLVNK